MKRSLVSVAAVAAVFLLAAASAQAAPVQLSFRDVAKKVLPVVVEINVTEIIKQQVPQFEFPFPFGPQQQGNGNRERTFRQNALGSGIIVRHTGDRYYVLTNNHVVDNATDISVRLYDQRVFRAKIVGKDPRKDIALVSFDTKDNLQVAQLGDSNNLEVGDIVLAVGNPFGFESTVTMGIVSALGRRQPQSSGYTDYIQTDAAINQGNSGGALVNLDGQVVGMNTWIAAPTGGNIGLGFAIPIDNAKPDIQALIATGKVEYGWLGAQIGDIQDNGAFAGFAKDLRIQGVNGAILLGVYKGSPADKAGLLPGDYITSIDGKAITNSQELIQTVGNLSAGKTYTFDIIRYGEKMSVRVTPGVRDEQDKVAQSQNLWPGMTVVDLSDQIRQELSIANGVSGVVVGSVTDQNTPAATAGFQTGDLITAIDGKHVGNMMDYYKLLNGSRNKVNFNVTRQDTQITLTLTR
jgi:serine protease Do